MGIAKFALAAAGRALSQVLALALSSTLTGFAQAGTANTFTVTATVANTSNWTVNGEADLGLSLVRGRTYVFRLNAVPSNHPFAISENGFEPFGEGVTGNGSTGTTEVTFAVPLTAPSTMFYICQFHPEMIGLLTIIDPPPPTLIFRNGFEDAAGG